MVREIQSIIKIRCPLAKIARSVFLGNTWNNFTYENIFARESPADDKDKDTNMRSCIRTTRGRGSRDLYRSLVADWSTNPRQVG